MVHPSNQTYLIPNGSVVKRIFIIDLERKKGNIGFLYREKYVEIASCYGQYLLVSTVCSGLISVLRF